MKTKFAQLALGLGIAVVSGIAAAQFGGVGSALMGGGSGSGSVSAESLVKTYVSGAKNVMVAQGNLLEAVGLKDEAAKSELAAKNLTEGATADSLKDSTTVQTENSKLLSEKFNDKSVTMDANAKKKYSEGLLNLAKGIKDYAVVSKDVKNYKPGVSSISSAGNAAAYVVQSLPTSTSNLTQTLKHAVEFARERKIEVPAEATSLL
jgi:hypothetical protein